MSFSILRACPCPHYTPGHTLSSLLRYTVLPLPPFIPNKEKSTASPCNLWPEPSIAFSLTTHPFQPQAWIIADNKGGARGCQDSAIVTSSEDYSLWLHPTTHKDGMHFCLFLQILNSRQKKDQNSRAVCALPR